MRAQRAGPRHGFVPGGGSGRAAPERAGALSESVWVQAHGRLICVAKEQLREATGSELYAPTDEELAELRKVEADLRREKRKAEYQDGRQEAPPPPGDFAVQVPVFEAIGAAGPFALPGLGDVAPPGAFINRKCCRPSGGRQ